MTDFNAHSGDRMDADLAALADLLDAGMLDVAADNRIAPRDADAPVPMSFAQELLWLLDRASPGMTAYNLPIARRLQGSLDRDALTNALSALVARHESLRTRLLEVDGEAHQAIDPPQPVALRLVDLVDSDPAQRAEQTQEVVRARARTPFNLAQEHCFRPTLVRVAADDHVLLLESHHIMLDGWSMGVLFRELEALYAAELGIRDAALAPSALQYGDYAIWQRARLSGPRLDELLTFWRGQLGDATEPLALPTDFPRPTTPGFAGAREAILLSPEVLERIRRTAHEHDGTLYMLLLAAYAAVLHRYSGRENVLIGSGSAGRTEAETEALVGYLNSTLVQRADFSGDPTFAQLLTRVRDSALGAYDHQDIPLEKLVMELRQGDERLSHAPLFEVVLTMQDTLPSSLKLHGLTVTPFGADLGATKFDITLLVSERPNGLNLVAQYRSDLFTTATMRRFLGHLAAVIDSAIANPEVRVSAIPLLTSAEQVQLSAWNDTAVMMDAPVSMVDLFEKEAARLGDQSALVAPSGRPGSGAPDVVVSLNYRELNAQANRLAHYLRSQGVRRGDAVALLLDRSADAVVGLLGILKAGGAYVPLSIDAPAARLAHQLEQCGARLVITNHAQGAVLPARFATVIVDSDTVTTELQRQPATNLRAGVAPADTAYVLFTSGSTGTPKGVAVTHANAVHYARAISRVLADVPMDVQGDGLAMLEGWRFGLASTLAADLGNTSLLPSLLGGGTLHILDAASTTSPEQYTEYARTHALDVLKITPNHFAALTAGRSAEELKALLPARWLVLGGEALRLTVANAFLEAGTCRILNHYGPTETTVGACTFEATVAAIGVAAAAGAQTVPLGTPLANMRAFVADAHGNDQPIGVPGELYLAGDGVADGYLGQPALTNERFVSLHGVRAYRTGDRVRRLETGVLEFLGRADDQVKIRGYRVELGDVEHALAQHPQVRQAVVAIRALNGAEATLTAFVTRHATESAYATAHALPFDGAAVRTWLRLQLPEYMVPDTIVLLDELPLTANGKIDRRRLPFPDDNPAAAYVAPTTEIEEQLAAIWADVLKRNQVGITDDFLALGGHSLLAIRVLGKISRTLGVRLPLRTLFDAPTIRQLAGAVAEERARSAPQSTIGARSREAYRNKTPATGDAGATGTGNTTTQGVQ